MPGAGPGSARRPTDLAWEVSRACRLPCADCRATNLPADGSPELDRREGLALIRSLAPAGIHRLLLTGPDPLERRESLGWLRAAAVARIECILGPSGTPTLAHGLLRRTRASGVSAVWVHLDGSSEAVHDRGPSTGGSFRWSMEAAASTVALGLRLTLRSRLGSFNWTDLPRLLDLARGLEATEWRLVLPSDARPIGPCPSEVEATLVALGDRCDRSPLRLYVEAAPHLGRLRPQLPAPRSMFVTADGRVLSEPFLPIPWGSVRETGLDRILRSGPAGGPSLSGRCGRCEHRTMCGGWRSRGWAATGDPGAEDPACPYEPPAHRERPGMP